MLGVMQFATKPRYRTSKPISAFLPKIFRKAFGRKSFAEQLLLTRWRDIVGDEYARTSLPMKLTRGRNNSGGTLSIQAESGVALLMQHDAPRIIERINKDSGYELVARLKFIQAPLPLSPDNAPTTETPPPKRATPAKPPPDLPEIEHASLREALARLARNLGGSGGS